MAQRSMTAWSGHQGHRSHRSARSTASDVVDPTPSDRGDHADRPKRSGRFTVALALFVVVTSAAGTAVAYQQTSVDPDAAVVRPAVAAQDEAAGAAVYDANCASCHQAGGTGVPGSFPPLAGNPNAADPAHVEQVVREGLSGPIDVNGETYDGTMPALPQLSDSEVADVAAYVSGLAEGGAAEPAEPPPAPTEAGTVEGGEILFSGGTALENGGAACVGCHTAGSVGNLGGPGLGPDLTDVAARLGGEAGLSAWLSNPPSPTMAPIFAERALTPEEIADITAFLVDAPDQAAPSQSVDWLLVAAAAGLAVLMAGMAIAYRGMRQNYRDRLVARTAARGGTRARAGAGTPGAATNGRR